MSTPSYSLLNTETFQRLNTLKAPKSVLQVLIALNAYAMGDNSCFPSLKTIREYIGTSIGLNTISCALKWLRENRFIEQNHRKSKERFVLTYRRAVKIAKGVLSGLRQNIGKDLSEQKHRREPSSFKNTYKHKRSGSSKRRRISDEEVKRRQEQAEISANNAENSMAKCIMGLDPTHLSQRAKLALYRGFSDRESPLRRWSRETNQEDFVIEVLRKIKSYCEDHASMME